MPDLCLTQWNTNSQKVRTQVLCEDTQLPFWVQCLIPNIFNQAVLHIRLRAPVFFNPVTYAKLPMKILPFNLHIYNYVNSTVCSSKHIFFFFPSLLLCFHKEVLLI